MRPRTSNQTALRQKAMLTLLLIAALTGSAARLNAASFVVTDLADAGPGTLRQAILDANTTPGDDTISFTTNGTITLVTELPAITDNTTITGPGINLLTVSGNKKVRVFFFNANTTNSLSALTVAEGRSGGEYLGGPLGTRYTNAPGVANLGTLSMRDCKVRSCRAYLSQGVGIHNRGILDLQNCTIDDIQADGGWPNPGGGLFNSGKARVSDCLFTNCAAGWYGPPEGGGGIYNAINGELFVSNTRITYCSGDRGPYGDAGGLNNLGNAVLDNCLIASSWGFSAGGILSGGSGSSLIMTNTTVENCKAAVGGGIYIYSSGAGTFSGCTIANNISVYSGLDDEAPGILNSGAQLAMYNCTISGNRDEYPTAPGRDHLGTGIRMRSSAAGITILDHCTVISNSGPVEILAQGTFIASNCILGTISGTNTSGGHNLIIDTNGCTLTGDTTGDLYNINPLLGPLRDNGGRSWTHALLPNSPAIDQTDAGGLLTDQRGFARPSAPLTSDIGAFEVIPVTPPTMAISYASSNSVVLSWNSAPAGFVLQQNAGFDANNWSDLAAAQNDDGTNRWVSLPTDASQKFYRLRLP